MYRYTIWSGRCKHFELRSLLGMATLITVVILQIPELQLVEVAGFLDYIFMALPNYSLGTAFNNLYTNSRAVEYCTRPIVVLACKTGLRPNPCCKGKSKSIMTSLFTVFFLCIY